MMVLVQFPLGRRKRKEACRATRHAAAACRLWEEEGSPSLSLHLYFTLNKVGCLGLV
jgi:hypothetical protein